jgi:hypothetical protein
VNQEISMVERVGLPAAVEQAADCIGITDIDGNIQCVNHAFTGMTGYTRKLWDSTLASSNRGANRRPSTKNFGTLSGLVGSGTARS